MVEQNYGLVKIPPDPDSPNVPSCLFNAMIAPLKPFALRGAIWYQGESNADRARQYRTLFPTMIRDWRRHWRQDDFQFLFVQLANFMITRREPEESQWAELREAQTMALRLPNTGMAVAIDIGDALDIHPRNKQDVGLRLALSALADVYRVPGVVGSGPLFCEARREGSALRVLFTQAAGGLVCRGSELRGFAVAGADRKFVWAQARIDRDTVRVWSPFVPEPTAVRYAWADNPLCNLYNAAGLPASPFRTDTE
jgi:sialate O-acetylesterase